MLQKMVFVIVAMCFVFSSMKANAALKKATDSATNPEIVYNPMPAPDDFEVPMPGGLKMVLRAVAVPAKNPLEDQEFRMGLLDSSEERSFYEKRRDAYVGAPFRQSDLPQEWQNNLPVAESKNFSYYFIGKYEISNAQWATVMGEELTERGELPKTNISWYDVQEFLRKYNEWVLREFPQSVPSIDNVPSFFRLPTEPEWEFAARGGNLPKEVMEFQDFFLEPDKTVEDYAVFGTRYENPMPIGSKRANRLGIYDMAGNVAEFVQGGFHFTITDSYKTLRFQRLHGAEGGLLEKGGSFLSQEEKDVYPGKRVENRMFEKQQDGSFLPHRNRSLGARIVLASTNTPGQQRIDTLLQAQNSLNKKVSKNQDAQIQEKEETPKIAENKPTSTKDQLVTIDPNGDPLEELEKISLAASSPFMKSNLGQFKELLQDVYVASSREREANLLSSLRSAAYKADSLSNIAFRCYQMNYTLQINLQDISAEKQKSYQAKIMEHYRNLERSTDFYRLSVQEFAEYPQKEVQNKLVQLTNEYAGKDKLNTAMRNNIEVFAKHVAFARTQGIERLTNSMIWKATIPVKEIVAWLESLGKQNK